MPDDCSQTVGRAEHIRQVRPGDPDDAARYTDRNDTERIDDTSTTRAGSAEPTLSVPVGRQIDDRS